MITACKKAGEFQLAHFNNPTRTEIKESISSVVSFVDIESEKIIIETIGLNFPSHNILSEECGIINKNSEYTWVIDPLDGTSNYAAGIPWFGILIALLINNEVMLSGAYLPVTADFYFAEKEKGSYLNNRKLIISEKPLKDCLFAFSTDYTNNTDYLQKGIEIYEYLIQHTRNVRTTNSLVDQVYVASEKLGGCINLFNRIWDIAATSLIMLEAGAKITNLDGSPLSFNTTIEQFEKNYAILSGNKMAFNQIQKFIMD